MDTGAIAASRLRQDQVVGRMVTRGETVLGQQRNIMPEPKVMEIPGDGGWRSPGTTRGIDSDISLHIVLDSHCAKVSTDWSWPGSSRSVCDDQYTVLR